MSTFLTEVQYISEGELCILKFAVEKLDTGYILCYPAILSLNSIDVCLYMIDISLNSIDFFLNIIYIWLNSIECLLNRIEFFHEIADVSSIHVKNEVPWQFRRGTFLLINGIVEFLFFLSSGELN